MLICSGLYSDPKSKNRYIVASNIRKNRIHLITGENGVGKTRFIEGILLKKIKKNGNRVLYFSQDIENQILSFGLIDLVKRFILSLKESGTFFKTILLNDQTHNSLDIDFDHNKVLHPDREAIQEFISNELNKYGDVDIIILDEVDKYFSTSEKFIELIEKQSNKTIIIISHILEDIDYRQLNINRITLKESKEGIIVE